MQYAGRVLYRPANDYADYLRQPVSSAGKHLYLNSAPLLELADGYFVVRDGEMRLRINGDLKEAAVGGKVSLELRFARDGSLSLVRSYYHSRRPLKVAVSIVSVLFLLVYLGRSYRFEAKGGYLVRR